MKINKPLTLPPVLRHSITLFSGAVFVGIFNYLFGIALARMIGPTFFGEYASLMSLLYLVVTPIVAVQTVTMQYTASLSSHNKHDELGEFEYFMQKQIVKWGIVFAVIFSAFSYLITAFFHLHSVVPVFILSAILVFSFLISFKRGILRGLHKNTLFVRTQLIEVILKLVFGIGFVLIGFTVSGALGGVLLGMYGGYLYAAKKCPNEAAVKHGTPSIFKDKSFIKYLIAVLAALIFITVFHTTDVIIIKHYFTPDIAGKFTALSVVTKVIYFVAMTVISASFPVIAAKYAAKESHLADFKHAFILVAGICFASIVGLFLFSDLIISIFLGKEFMDIVPYLGLYSVFMSIVSFNTLFMYYFLSLRYTKFIYYFGVGAMAQVVLLILFHTTILQIIYTLIIINFMVLLLTLWNYYVFKIKTI